MHHASEINDSFRVLVCNPLCMLEIFLATENWVANLNLILGLGRLLLLLFCEMWEVHL